ncbi:MAG: Ig-like domain-containing protein, partial [Spirochaetales bacterium]|nr:Ig-like domain-containing protein [Spirochaetales bacterium]
ETLEEYNKYTISITTSAVDIYGNNLGLPFSFSFSNLKDEVRPVLLSHIPEDRDILNQNNQAVILTFSESMDITSVLDAFSILPSIDGSYSWNADTTIFTFTPYQSYTWQTEYRVNLTTSASDLMGNTLAASNDFTFFVGLDSIPPSLQQLSNGSGFILMAEDDSVPGITVNSLWEADWSMEFNFNPEDQISITSFRTKLNFEPAVTFEITSPEDLFQNPIVITFPDRLTWGTTYRIKLEEGFEDEYLNTGEEETYYIKVDGPLTSPPVVKDVSLLVDPGDLQCTIIHNFDSFPFDTYDISNLGFIDLYVALPRPGDVSTDTILFSFMDNFDFVSPSTALTATIQEVRQIAAGDTYLARAAAADELVFRIYIVFQDQDSGGIGKILLNKDFDDSLGNLMANDFEMRIQIQ